MMAIRHTFNAKDEIILERKEDLVDEDGQGISLDDIDALVLTFRILCHDRHMLVVIFPAHSLHVSEYDPYAQSVCVSLEQPMFSAFKAIGKFLFGSGQSQTQPQAAPPAPCACPEPDWHPKHQQAHRSADLPFLGGCRSQLLAQPQAARPAWELIHGNRCTFRPNLLRSASFPPMPDPQFAMMAAAMMHENGRLVQSDKKIDQFGKL